MNTSPTIDDMLAGVISAISTDIVPALGDPKAHASAAMMQSLLQTIRQLLPVYDANLIEEHNDMTRVLRDVAETLGAAEGDAAGRVRERAATLGQLADLPAPHDQAAAMAAHRELSHALGATMVDLDELQRVGWTRADEALQVLRAHLGPRYLRDTATVIVGEDGMIGRG